MTQRLKKTEYIMSYMIIISLACFIGGFFLGATVMENKITTEITAKAEAEKDRLEKEQLKKEHKLYKEPDFVSFYYGIYVPLKTFKNEHFYYVADLQGKPKAEQIAISSDMRTFVEEKREELDKAIIPASSPLLLQSKNNYLKSLQSYVDGMNRLIKDDQAFTEETIATLKHLDTFKTQWLVAQSDMYKAIATWEEIYITRQSMPRVNMNNLTILAWQSYPYHFRNYLAAEYMLRGKKVVEFNPEDLTARIDSVVKSGEADSLGWRNIPFAVNVLYATDAVGSNDFQHLRDKLYPALTTPEMPIFTE